MAAASRALEDLLRELAPQVLGAVTRRHGDFADAEDAVQDALLAAATQWPAAGVPDNPRGWLYSVAMRRLIDQVRSDSARREREQSVGREASQTVEVSSMPDDDLVTDGDDTLLLLFMCCHASLTPASAIALTLRAVGGLTTREIASAFLVPESTMAQRISRAKQTIASSEVPFAMPTATERSARLASVMQVLYLIFNEGYASSGGAEVHRVELGTEAIRLTRELHRLVTDDSEVTGLLALMLLTDARRAARTGADGELIPLDKQDRSRWNAPAIVEGIALVSSALRQGRVGPYQLQAAIAAIHDEATTVADTDWPQILAFYELLARMQDNPVVRLNRAIATAMVHGAAAGLAQLDALAEDQRMMTHYRIDAVRGHLYDIAGDPQRAAAHLQSAAERTASIPERNYLLAKAARLLAAPALMLCALTATRALHAQSVENAVTGLAQQWSASGTPPRCTRAPGRSGLDRQQQPFNCFWTAPAVPPGGTLTGTVYANTGKTVVRWQRPTLDPADASRVRDSLVHALELRGLKERPCGATGSDGVGLWVTANLAVHIASVMENSGIPHLVVTATTDPDDTPEAACGRR